MVAVVPWLREMSTASPLKGGPISSTSNSLLWRRQRLNLRLTPCQPSPTPSPAPALAATAIGTIEKIRARQKIIAAVAQGRKASFEKRAHGTVAADVRSAAKSLRRFDTSLRPAHVLPHLAPFHRSSDRKRHARPPLARTDAGTRAARLLYRGVELRNSGVVDDYNMQGGTALDMLGQGGWRRQADETPSCASCLETLGAIVCNMRHVCCERERPILLVSGGSQCTPLPQRWSVGGGLPPPQKRVADAQAKGAAALVHVRPDWRAVRAEALRHLRAVHDVFADVEVAALMSAHSGQGPAVTRRRRYPRMGLFVRLGGE